MLSGPSPLVPLCLVVFFRMPLTSGLHSLHQDITRGPIVRFLCLRTPLKIIRPWVPKVVVVLFPLYPPHHPSEATEHPLGVTANVSTYRDSSDLCKCCRRIDSFAIGECFSAAASRKGYPVDTDICFFILALFKYAIDLNYNFHRLHERLYIFRLTKFCLFCRVLYFTSPISFVFLRI